MFVDLLIVVLVGTFIGFLVGLVPGIHPNTLFVMLLASPVLYGHSPFLSLVFIVSVSVSNTISDFIPSIMLGAPEPATALSVLPAHRMLLSGKGYEALLLTVVGGMGVTMLTVATMPLLVYVVPAVYHMSKPFIGFVLALVLLWMITSEKHKKQAVVVSLLCGVFGLFSLSALPSSLSLFPVLTGLFGASALLLNTRTRTTLPQQETEPTVVLRKNAIFAGWFSGIISGMLPGVGSSQTGAITSQIFRTNRKDFLISLGGINTSNILFTFIMFHALGKIRSGATAAAAQILHESTNHALLLVASASLISCFISSVFVAKTGKKMLAGLCGTNYSRINTAVLIFLVVIVSLLSGPLGLLVFFTATLAGMYTIKTGVSRSLMMSYFILPTSLFFISGAVLT